MGCIGYELCTRQYLPHARRNGPPDNIEKYAKEIDLSEIPTTIFSGYVLYVIQRCLTWDMSRRPTAAQMRENLRRYIDADIALETRSIFTKKVSGSSGSGTSSSVSTAPIEEDDQILSNEESLSKDVSLPDIHEMSEAELVVKSSYFATDLTLNAQKKEEVLFDSDEEEMDDFGWTTGGDPAFTHKEVIDTGASGEVHEVPLLLNAANLAI
jgi:hypothetical protein